MDQAGAGVAQTVAKFFANPGKCIVFAEKVTTQAMHWFCCGSSTQARMENRSPARVQARGLQRTHAQEAGNLRRRPPEILGAASASGPGDLSITFAELSAEVADQLSTATGSDCGRDVPGHGRSIDHSGWPVSE